MNPKEAFLINQFWQLTFSAGFQRAYVYNKNVKDNEKEPFKKALRKYIETELLPQYSQEVAEDVHIQNIKALSSYSGAFAPIITQKDGKLNFGVSQKILNLILKFLWVYDKIPTPPHFPVDRRIQEHIRFKPEVAWTQFENEKDYERIMAYSKAKMQKTGHSTLAEFELDYYERRIPTA